MTKKLFQLSAFSFLLSALSAFSFQLSAKSFQLSAFSFLLSLLSALSALPLSAQTSPNGRLKAAYVQDKGLVVSYRQSNAWQDIMTLSTPCSTASKPTSVKVNYTMQLGKRSRCKNAYRESIYTANGSTDRIQVRVYNDGVAWSGAHDYKVSFANSTNNWVPTWSVGYEDFFPLNRELKQGEHYAYPALFQYSGDVFALISESCMEHANAATSMWKDAAPLTFDLRPEGPENGGWQTLIVGSLSDVVESTLITDNSLPRDKSLFPSTPEWVQPGVASWVYWAYNHGSNDYNIIKSYTDMAVALHLPYVLIDAEWDNFLPPYTVEDAIRYATDRGIKPIIWYSSSIGWIDGAPGPKFRLNKPEDREREFDWLNKMGVVGVKIDFFSGDNNQNIAFMIDLLESAARHHLLVNFHGATITRGWQRTYPNLVSTEGVYGAEWYNNVGTFTNRAARHNATLPFTRNVIGSMDYTPCAFTDSQHPHITTHAHELALTALYESGVQHLADRPESFLAQPQEVKDYLGQLPTAWDETLLLSGYPGESVVMARRKGKVWYIAGINGTDDTKEISFPLSRLRKLGKHVTAFMDGPSASSPWLITTPTTISTTVLCKPRGGFLYVIR